MRKSFLLKLLMLAVCAAMLLSLFACNGDPVETEPTTDEQTEGKTDPAETDPTESTPAESEPTESKPAESKPAESKPAESDPAESKPAESDPAESKPAESDPAESKPAESDPAESKPAETDPVEPECGYEHELKAKGNQGHYTDACAYCGAERSELAAHNYETVGGKPTCKDCGHVATCNGEHAYVSDAENHWKNFCDACRYEGEAEAPHTPVYADGKYACTVCGYEYTCPTNGVHELVNAGEAGHHTAACPICNAAEGENVPHVYEGADRICACGEQAACKGVHQWTSDAEGHQEAACDVCGAVAGEKLAHDETLTELGVYADGYKFGCATCGYATYTKTLTDKVAAIIVPGNVNTMEANLEKGNLNISTKYQAATTLNVATDGMPFTSIAGTGTVSQLIWNRHLGDVVDRSAYEEYTFDIGQAKYLVIKARATMAEDSVVSLGFSTAGAEGYKSVILPLVKATENAEWITYVIDLEKTFAGVYAKADGAETYVVDTFYFHMQPFTTTDVLDVAYMAFVEGGWSDIGAVVDEETVISVVASNLGNEVNADTGACINAHVYSTTVVDGVYKSVCACGHVKASYNVSADAPNKFFGAEYLVGKTSFNGTADLELLYDETDGAFVRLDNMKANATNWFGWQAVSWENGNFGQYIVMKIRIGENGLGQTTLNIYTNSVASNKAGIEWPQGNLNFKVSEDGKWHYVVVDLAARVPNNAYQAGENNTYAPNYFQIRAFTGYQTTAQADDYMDIAFIAYCDSLDDIKGIVDAETYDWSVDPGTNALRNTADNTCAAHAWTEEISGTTHTIKCTLCGEVNRTFEIPTEINWYAPLSGMGKFQHSIEKMLFDEEEGVMFNRYTGTGGNHLNITGGNGGAGDPTSGTFTTGKYIVIKYRATEATLGFNVATGDKKSGNGKSLGTQAIANLPGDEWRVAVIDASASEQWTSDGSAQTIYLMITTGGNAPYVVDIAYVAVVDSIDEMKLLLQEGETYFDMGTDWAGTPTERNQDGTKVPCADGKHSITEAVAGTDENGNTTYAYVCAACDSTLQVATVTSAVSKYYTPNEIVTVAKQYFSIANNGTKRVTGETDIAYAAINNFRQLIYMRNNADMAHAQEAQASQYGTMNVGNAKYAVIKFRSDDANAWMTLSLSFEGHNGTVNVATENLVGYHKPDGSKDSWEADGKTVTGVLAGNEAVVQNGYKGIKALEKGAATGEWVTVVIDLEAACGDVYAKTEGAEDYVVDYFVVDLEGAIDISYIAFLEGDMNAVEDFVGEDEVVVISE